MVPRLGGQLHSIPLHAADASAQPLLLLCEHVLRSVAKLVEQRLHLAAAGAAVRART